MWGYRSLTVAIRSAQRNRRRKFNPIGCFLRILFISCGQHGPVRQKLQ